MGDWVYKGQFASFGQGNGQFWWPADVDLDAGGNRLYVSDNGNDRVQYFKRENPAVTTVSPGRVKALFRSRRTAVRPLAKGLSALL